MTLPNLISLGRLLLVPAIVWLMLVERWSFAFALFVLAGVSDAIDGFIARRFRSQSRVGALLDPIADKTLLVAVFVTLGIHGILSEWLVVLVVSRDLLVVGGASLLLMLGQANIGSIWTGKLNTALQVVLAALVLAGAAFGPEGWWVLAQPLMFAVAVTTVASGALYLVAFARRVADMEGAP